MNFAPPPWAREAAEQALRSVEGNHYSPPKGRLRLRKALKEFYSPQFGRELDPELEIVVTSGANEGESDSRFASDSKAGFVVWAPPTFVMWTGAM